MIRSSALVFLLLIGAFRAGAQTRITVGKPYGVIDAEGKIYFVRNGEILTVKIRNKNVTLQKMDAVTLAFQKIRLYDDFPKDCQFEKITQFKDHYYVFYSAWKEDRERLYCREIDFASGNFAGPGQEIFSVEEKLTGSLLRTGLASMAVSDKFDFFFSYDSSAMLVKYRLKPEIRKDDKNYDVIGMHVFDQHLHPRWSRHIRMPYTEKRMDNLDYSIDVAGNVYLATRVFDDNTTDQRKPGEDNANYHLEVLKVSAGTGAITHTTIKVADKFVETIWLYESVKGYMVCAGFYNTGKDLDNADGIMMFKLQQNGSLEDMSFFEIPVEILNQYASSRTQRRNERKDSEQRAEFESLALREIVMQKDESLLLLGEQRFIRTYYSYINGQPNSNVTFHANDMLVTKISKDGKLQWMKKLPKRQSGSGYDDGMSYRYVTSGEHHYFLFLDNEKNLNLPITEEPVSHSAGRGGFLTAYKVNDDTGEVEKISLLDTRDVNGMEVYQIAPYRMMSTAPNTLVFEAYKKKKEDILVKVVLD
jgi:hypothetical protein